MPPSRRIKREDILNTAYQLILDGGLQSLNARRIAAELGCSVQPIYDNFSAMSELKDEVMKQITGTYIAYMREGAGEKKPYLGMGLSYIRFARDYPNLFKILFMSESRLSPEDFIQSDDVGTAVLEAGRNFSGLPDAEQRRFHLKVWIFTHGLAALAATKTVVLTDGEIGSLLTSATREMLTGFKTARKQEEETQIGADH